MGQYVDIVGVLSRDAQSEAEQQLREHLIRVQSAYLPAFETIRSELQSQYIETQQYSKNLSIEDRIQKAKAKRAQIYKSSKGGGYILPHEQLELSLQEQIELNKERLKNQLKIARANAYSIREENKYKILAGKMMALIYSLKAQLTGVEEKFAFVYEGDSGFAETVTIPVTEFLSSSSIMEQMTLQTGSIIRWTGVDDHALRFNTSVLAQIKKTQTVENDLLNGLENGGNLLSRYYNIKNYGTYSKTIGSKTGYATKASALKTKGDNVDYQIIREESGRYFVIDPNAKFEGGFIVQGLLGQVINDENATFIGDNEDFYKKADISNAFGEEYSVKSFLDGQIPSLVTIGTLYKISEDIINALKSDISNMGKALTDIFNVTKTPLEKIDSLANQDIDNVINKILSG